MTREEAIRRIRMWNLDEDDREVLSVVIPELAETEDQRLLKELIGGLMWQRDNLKCDGERNDGLILPGFTYPVGELLTYLRKKKEFTKIFWPGMKDNWVYIQDFVEQFGRLPNDVDELDVLISYVENRKEKDKADEEKNQEEKQPLLKFSVGDHIKKKGDYAIWTISSINSQYQCYEGFYDEGGYATMLPFELQDDYMTVEEPKVRAKFKPGDWVRFKGSGTNVIYVIESVSGDRYICTDGNGMDISYTDANFECVNKSKDDDPLPLMDGNSDLYFDEWNQRQQNPTKRQCFEEGMRYAERLNGMIQWTGDNLKEVVAFTGKDPKFEKWFRSWNDYENYVHSHGDIFKLFREDGSHLEVPVGAWIVRTPDGYKVPSVFRLVK